MKRRAYLTLSTASLASLSGCIYGFDGDEEAGGDPSGSVDDGDDQAPSSEPESTEPESTEPESPNEETYTVEGEFLSNESDPSANLENHRFENTNSTTSPWAVTGTVSQSSGERANIQVSVNFVDEDGVVISDSYDLLTSIANEQLAQFIVRYTGDDPTLVASYEIFVEV